MTQMLLFDDPADVAAIEEPTPPAPGTWQERRAAFIARFGHPWVAPWDCGDGTPAGTVREDGARCPCCHQVEANGYLLGVNHGIDEHLPASWDRTTCSRQQLTRSQASAALGLYPGTVALRCTACGTWTDQVSLDRGVGGRQQPYACVDMDAAHQWTEAQP